MSYRAWRKLKLVLPHPRHHLAHHHNVHRAVEIADHAMKAHQSLWRLARSRHLVEWESPQVVHEESGGESEDQEGDPKSCAGYRAHALGRRGLRRTSKRETNLTSGLFRRCS